MVTEKITTDLSIWFDHPKLPLFALLTNFLYFGFDRVLLDLMCT